MRKILALVLTGASRVRRGQHGQRRRGDAEGGLHDLPTKLSKKKFKNVKFVNTITTSNAPGSTSRRTATRTVVDWPQAVQVQQQEAGLPARPTRPASRPATTVEDAKTACGKKSVVSDRRPAAPPGACRLPAGVLTIDIDVDAFNEKGNELLLLQQADRRVLRHPASILVGKLKDSKAGSAYGKALDVTIPPLSAGGDLVLQVTIPKSEYIQAKCKPKKVNAPGDDDFRRRHAADVGHAHVKCKVQVVVTLRGLTPDRCRKRGGLRAAPFSWARDPALGRLSRRASRRSGSRAARPGPPGGSARPRRSPPGRASRSARRACGRSRSG